MAKRARHVTDAHAVVVLAAGGSTRLGQPKQLLTRQGETLVHRVVRLAREVAPAQVLVVVGANAQAVTSSIAGLDATPVTNHHWERGLASSLQVAGAHLLPTVTAVMVVAPICRRCFRVPALRRQGARVPVMETRLAFLQWCRALGSPLSVQPVTAASERA